MLAGHTHGGQITVARLNEIAVGKIGGHKYVHGLYGTRQPRRGAVVTGAVYVGAGIGASVMPFRIGERGKREITIFEFGRRPGEFEEPDREQEPLPGRAPSPRKLRRRAEKVVRRRPVARCARPSRWTAVGLAHFKNRNQLSRDLASPHDFALGSEIAPTAGCPPPP